MNQRAAFDETVRLAEESRQVPEAPDSPFGLAHLREMQSRITDDFSEAKLGRWLGWAQAALVHWANDFTLDDVKQINLRHSDASGVADFEPWQCSVCGWRAAVNDVEGHNMEFNPRLVQERESAGTGDEV